MTIYNTDLEVGRTISIIGVLLGLGVAFLGTREVETGRFFVASIAVALPILTLWRGRYEVITVNEGCVIATVWIVLGVGHMSLIVPEHVLYVLNWVLSATIGLTFLLKAGNACMHHA